MHTLLFYTILFIITYTMSAAGVYLAINLANSKFKDKEIPSKIKMLVVLTPVLNVLMYMLVIVNLVRTLVRTLTIRIS